MSTEGLTTHESNDWMQLEPHLVALVRAAVQDLRPAVHVLTAAELADVKEQAQLTPAVHVIYGGFRITDSQRTAWQLTHTWYAVAAVRNVATVRSGQAARAQAGSLAARVLAAHALVVGVEQHAKRRVEGRELRLEAFQDEGLEEPGGVRQVPFDGAGLQHGLRAAVFGRQRRGQALGGGAHGGKALAGAAACGRGR